MMSPPSTDTHNADDASVIFLTQTDVNNLLNDNSPDSRINVLDKISVQFAEGSFNERELLFAEQIFRVLMKDTELRVREMLAETAKDNPNVPRDVILHLAHDIEQVALPIIQASTVLSDADLIDIIETSREVSKLMAVTKRDRVSSRVSSALVDTHYPQVVKSLLNNEQATISESDYEQILSEFSHEDAITNAMVDRAKLPVSIVEKLINVVSDALSEQLKEQYDIDASDIGQEARENVTLDLLTFTKSDDEVDAAIGQMMTYNRLTPSIILTSLCQGHVNFFEISLAKMANIPKPNARKLIHDKGPLGFQALYNKTGLPESMFEAVRLVLQVAQHMKEADITPATPNYPNMMVERILAKAGDREIDNLPYIIALIRQG